MNDLPTPEELGEKLKAGEITKEEAIEVMSERARREAFSNMLGGTSPDGDSRQAGGGAAVGAAGKWILFGIILVLVLIFLLLQMLG
jgi:hypothetical protein